MLSIAIYGEQVLNQVAQPVTVFDSELQTLADEMLNTMQQAHGVGIAAPQVHRSLQMFIMASNPNSRYPDAPLMAPQVVINPQILQTSEAQVWGEEGCLSLPQERCQVARFESIEVRYQDLSGEWCQEWLSGFVARIFQHEFDHLQGITLRERTAKST
ncbi:peptide deformylase [Shewanella avicenniae]|uniref:Peptide deformylase n=1 Tax=Shewanella avicenniae TaxID=2814294 RepID=A0ABX7QQU0_9GAMM|nr:peptide deformylase [Shewanella avicenniae]QSX33066.1 peptide deformylase [Shewanella avicenniae]